MENRILKNKFFVIPVALLLAMALVAAAVLYASANATITVNEALSTTTTDIAISGYPGETISESVTITNAGSVALNTSVNWVEDVNDANVTYTSNMPSVVALAPGANTVTVEFTIAPDSEVGAFNGTVEFVRIAA